MKKLTLTHQAQSETVVLENEFIDRYMTKANGEYVKVYLLLLRYLNEPSGAPTVSKIADILDYTEKDVIRALNYWKKQGLLDYETSESGPQTDSQRADRPQTERPKAGVPRPAGGGAASDVSDISQYKSRREFRQLLFVAEQYLGKMLTATDVETITYCYDTLHMSSDLIDYLIEYCVENGHKSIHYIRKVALSWHEQGITTVEEAKAGTLRYNKNCYSVLNAFGIKGRAPAASELSYIRRWNEEYAFPTEIIVEACSRTIAKTHEPSFEYADSILRSWKEKGVRHLKDIEALDAEHIKSRKPRQKTKAAAANNKFNNFDSRSYDMNDLERRLVQQ